MADAARLRIDIGDDNLTDGDKAALAQALARELRDLDAVQEVKPATEEAPEGARPIEGFTWGALILALVPMALAELIGFLKSWSKRPGGQPVNISIQIGHGKIEGEYDPATMTSAEIEELAKRLRGVIGD
jgi:hypothetical protein